MIQKRSMMIAAVLIALVSLAFVAVACGDDNGGNGDDAEATEPADENGENGVEPTEMAEPADGNGEGAETAIDVDLSEFAVTPSESSAAAGTVTFSVSNSGDLAHTFEVIASDLAADGLPVDEDAFVVDETAVTVVASTVEDAGLATGESEDVTVDLEAGNYVLICNLPTHYTDGMSVAFTVE